MPVPYGVADFDAPENLKDKIAYLHQVVVPFLAVIRSAGAEWQWRATGWFAVCVPTAWIRLALGQQGPAT